MRPCRKRQVVKCESQKKLMVGQIKSLGSKHAHTHTHTKLDRIQAGLFYSHHRRLIVNGKTGMWIQFKRISKDKYLNSVHSLT